MRSCGPDSNVESPGLLLIWGIGWDLADDETRVGEHGRTVDDRGSVWQDTAHERPRRFRRRSEQVARQRAHIDQRFRDDADLGSLLAEHDGEPRVRAPPRTFGRGHALA